MKKVNLICRECKPESSHLPFGGMFVYMFGDIKQLPPVQDSPFFSESATGNEYQLDGKLLYQ